MNRNPNNPTAVIRRRIAATREELFDTWTDPEGMRIWMCPGDIVSSEVSLDLRVGGTLVIKMQGPKHVYEHRGRFKVIDRPSKLAFTWEAAATEYRETLVTIELIEISPSETEMVLTHERFPSLHRRDQYEQGWGRIVSRLEDFLRASV